jgi:hypothetical protein
MVTASPLARRSIVHLDMGMRGWEREQTQPDGIDSTRQHRRLLFIAETAKVTSRCNKMRKR